MTRDGINFTNNGQFALSGTTNFVINPGLIQQPASGTVEIYVVTMSNTGGGTTLATITVSHGSTHIDSVVISQGLIVPVLSAITLSPSGYLVFGATAPTFVPPTSASSGAITYTSSSTDVATIDSNSGVITIVGTGISTITATQAANGNYATASTTATLTVAATPSLTGFNAISKTYGDAAFSLSAPTSASAGAFTYTSSNTAVATISGSTVTVVSVGTSTITATQAANGNYATASTTATLTVTTGSQATLTASASASSIVAITGTSTLSTSGGSGTGAVTYATTGDCTISGTTLTAGATIGTCTVTATKAADANYAVATGTVNVTVTAIGTQANPTFSPAAGAIAFGTTVTITSSGADAIYYTTDGSTPTTSSTNQATTPLVINTAVTVKALAVKAGYTNSAIGSAAYTQAVATAPSAVILAVGSSNPVGGVTNVAIPAAGATDTTGAVTGWVTATADTIKFTVTNGGSSASTITINGSPYTSGDNYTISAASTLTIVVTTTETNKVTAVRTFTVSVSAPIVINTAAISGVTAPVTGATPVTTTTAGSGYTGTVTWSPSVSGTFAYNTAYTATVTLTAASGYTLTGVTANFFTVSGATTTNPINSGVVTAVFPATGLPAGYVSTQRLGTAGSVVADYDTTSRLNGGGTLIWSKNNSTVASPGTANYSAAAAACDASTALGYSDWRLPTQPELSGLYNAGTTALTTAGWTLYYTWSSTAYGASHYSVVLENGYVGWPVDSTVIFVSCVH